MPMYEKWKSMTVNELYEEIEELKREAERRDKTYIDAARNKESQRHLSELNQEHVEVWMMIEYIRKEIVERRAKEAKIQPSFPPSQKSISRQMLATRLEIARRQLDEHRFQDAVEQLNIILAGYPRHAETLYYRGLALAQLKQHQQAVDAFTAALQTQPKMIEAYRERAKAYGRLRQYDLEVRDLTQLIDSTPNDAETYLERGLTFNLIKQYDKALADFNKAAQLAPEDEEAYYFRAGVYMELGDYRRALADCELALKYRPEWLLPLSRIKEIQELMSKG
jgi:tetratricopeptide (TPR) repeat protein